MLKTKVILANNLLDRHGESLDKNTLKDAMEITNKQITSSHLEHDFTKPPIGRVEQAELCENGQFTSLVGHYSLFEKNDINKENPFKNRILATHFKESGKITILYDRTCIDPDLKEKVENLQKLLDPSNEIEFELKKSLEPISTLTILVGLGTLVSTAFLTGFFEKMGADAWDALRDIIQRKFGENSENHYQFIFTLSNESNSIEIIIIFKNPKSNEIQTLLNKSKKDIEDQATNYFNNSINVSRIVYLAETSSIKHIYSVHPCGTPFDIADQEEYEKILQVAKANMFPSKSD